MRLLDRYLLRELFFPLVYCLGGFLIFWISFDLFSTLDEFRDNQLTGGDIAAYYLVLLPQLLQAIIMPVSLLLALLYTLTNHARHNELIAIRAAGVSMWRLSLPYLAVGFVFSVGLGLLNDVILPDGAERAEAIMERHVERKENDGWFKVNFRNDPAGRQWEIGAYNPLLREMRNVNLSWQLPAGSRRQIIAERAVWTDEVWQFTGVVQFTYRSADDATPKREALPQLLFNDITASPEMLGSEMKLIETPSLLKSEIKIGRLTSIKAAKKVQLSVREILRYLRLHPGLADRDYALIHTQLHGRLAEPWTCLVVVLVALPFGAAASGRRNVMVGVASSVLIVFAYFIVLRMGLAFGTSGHIPPWLAAWLPNVLFAALGAFLTARVR